MHTAYAIKQNKKGNRDWYPLSERTKLFDCRNIRQTARHSRRNLMISKVINLTWRKESQKNWDTNNRVTNMSTSQNKVRLAMRACSGKSVPYSRRTIAAGKTEVKVQDKASHQTWYLPWLNTGNIFIMSPSLQLRYLPNLCRSYSSQNERENDYIWI